jgi:hypothetical protein
MATDVDLVEWHAELGGKVLLHQRARLVLHQEVLLEHAAPWSGAASRRMSAASAAAKPRQRLAANRTGPW